MSKITVIFHSGYGHTKKIAGLVLEGMQSVSGVDTALVEINSQGQITEEEWGRLDSSDMIVFGTPTYMANVSGPFKMWADQTSRRFAKEAWKGKYAAGFSNSGSLFGDKSITLDYLATFAGQHGMPWVPLGILSSGTGKEDINRVGASLGLMTQSDNDSPEVTPSGGDLETAKRFGIRLAEFMGLMKGK